MTAQVFRIAIAIAIALSACTSSPPTGTVVVVGRSPGNPLAADTGHLYWPDVIDQVPGIFKVPVDAVDATPVHVVDTPGQASWLAVDATSAYWVDEEFTGSTPSVEKAPLGGGAPMTLAAGINAPTGLALDGSRAYWGDYHSVFAVPLTGGSVQDLADDKFAQSLIVHGTHAYWSTVSTLRSLDLTDPAATPMTVVTSYVLTFGVDDTNIYWLTCDQNGPSIQPVTLLAAPLAGGPTRTLLEATARTNMYFQPIEVDESGVYWSDGVTITRVGTDGTGAREVANAAWIGDFVLGPTDVYFAASWKDASTSSVVTGIRKVPKD